MFFYTSIAYVNEIVETVKDQLDPILSNRLQYSTQALATMFYMIDKLGIDSSKRLSGMYDKASETNPFPIKENAVGYELYDQARLKGSSKRVFNAGATC